MIASLRGVIAAIDPLGDAGAEVVVDVDGVGYEVTVGARCAAGLPPVGDRGELAIYTHVREGAITLFGFADRDERRIFSLLITAHGVGPALGLAILGSLSPSALIRAVTTGDQDALILVPGVGKKTAQRLVIELAERFGSVVVPTGSGAPILDGDRDLREALASLGYSPDDIRVALSRIPEEGQIEERLRFALRELSPAVAGR